MKTLLSLALVLALLCAGLPTVFAEDEIVLDGSATEMEAPTPAPYAPQPTPFVTLQRNSSGEGVQQVQERLTELGYYHGEISGNFLDGTDAATRDFQKASGLAANGKITATTWNALMNPSAIGKDGLPHPQQAWQSAHNAQAAPNIAQAAQPTPPPPPSVDQASATIAPLPASGFVFQRKLQVNDQGDDVSALQQRLTDLGYYSIKITGNYLNKTRDAVRAFQKVNGLVADGTAGEETQRMIWDPVAALPAGSPPRPAPTPEPPRYLLTVDVTNQVTRAYERDANGEYTTLVRQMICSTGTKTNPTPLKTTHSKGARARWGYFPEWDSHAQYLTRIDSKNAFHSVLYSAPDSMSLVVGAYNALGQRASHGCVRLLVADAKWIYDNCPSGTTITVFAGESDPELTHMLKPPSLDKRTMLPRSTPAPTAPPIWDPSNPPTTLRLLKKGATGPDVWWLQTTLTALGFYHGTISGQYYEGTVGAVRAFQKSVGLSTDGIAGVTTQKRLYSIPITLDPSNAGYANPSMSATVGATLAPIASTPIPIQQQINVPSPTVAPGANGTVWLTPPPPPPGMQPAPAPAATPQPIGGGVG